jgi:hypothetical protein
VLFALKKIHFICSILFDAIHVLRFIFR